MLAGCDDTPKDEPGGGEPAKITLPDASEKIQAAYADEETTGGFTFTAETDWTASVKENAPMPSAHMPAAKASGASWLRLLRDGTETYGGKAGTHTLTVSLEQNFTGAARSATITVACGGDKITVSATQAGTTLDGDVPVDPDPDPDPSRQYERYVARIEYTDKGEVDMAYSFEYDDLKRFTRYVYENNREGQGLVVDETFRFSYIDRNTIEIVAKLLDAAEETATVRLNDGGSIVSFRIEGDSTDRNTYSYENGYLARVGFMDHGSERGKNATWQNGNLVSYAYDYGTFKESYTYTSYPNNPKVNLDFNGLFVLEDDMFSLLDLTGKRSNKYVATGKPFNQREYAIYNDGKIHIETEVIYDPMTYTFDAQGYVETITLTWTEKVVETTIATGATKVLGEKTDKVSWRIIYAE